MTAIPSHKSRAMFECIKFPEEMSKDSSSLGYIMFECGLEGIGTKIVKRYVYTLHYFLETKILKYLANCLVSIFLLKFKIPSS